MEIRKPVSYTHLMELENFLKGLKQGKNFSGNAEEEPEEDDDDTVLYVSDQMRKVITVARTVAKTDATVLITGETGTGKEVLSNVIVRSSKMCIRDRDSTPKPGKSQ